MFSVVAAIALDVLSLVKPCVASTLPAVECFLQTGVPSSALVGS